jgi:hypothetical protein
MQRFTIDVKLEKAKNAMGKRFSWISRICRLLGFEIIRVHRQPKRTPKESRFSSVSVYDDDWQD